MIDRYQLKHSLEKGVMTIVFEKTDGTLREMRCTLQTEYLPPQLLQEGVESRSRTENMDTLSVWDIENGGWRSFRMDSIKSITVG